VSAQTPAQATTAVRAPAKTRQFAVAVLACAAGAGVALFAASRTWLVEVTAQPDPLPATTVTRAGGSLLPLLPALALVALAGAGGLLATRGRARQVVAGLITLAGLGVAVSPIGEVGRGGVAVGWVVVSMLAGLAVAAVGVLAVRRGRSWPSMGARYERAASTAAAGATKPDRDLWAALDRGEDPTKE
jgi:hypothetical protein